MTRQQLQLVAILLSVDGCGIPMHAFQQSQAIPALPVVIFEGNSFAMSQFQIGKGTFARVTLIKMPLPVMQKEGVPFPRVSMWSRRWHCVGEYDETDLLLYDSPGPS